MASAGRFLEENREDDADGEGEDADAVDDEGDGLGDDVEGTEDAYDEGDNVIFFDSIMVDDGLESSAGDDT